VEFMLPRAEDCTALTECPLLLLSLLKFIYPNLYRVYPWPLASEMLEQRHECTRIESSNEGTHAAAG